MALAEWLALYSRDVPTNVFMTSNHPTPDERTDVSQPTAGRLLSLDLGTKRVGVAVSDELRLTARPLPFLQRHNWKKLLREIAELRERFDAQMLVVGLPLNMDGTEGAAASESRRIARNLELSLGVPVQLQDERLTSHTAEMNLRQSGVKPKHIAARVDSEAAALILLDYISEHGTQLSGNVSDDN